MTQYTLDIIHAACTPLPWENLEQRNILVLGATGLIGECLVTILMAHNPASYHVYAAGRNEQRAHSLFAQYADNSRFHFIRIDVELPINCDIDFHYIIDAAGGAAPHLYATNPVGVMKGNILGVCHILDYGLQHRLEKFVYLSSGEVYGEGDGRVFTEDYSGYVDCTQVRACYPSAKRASETLCMSYAKQYGIKVSVARPCHIYGPHFSDSDNRVYAQFIRNVIAHQDIIMKSNGEQFRSWCYVVDCATALLYILLKGANGEAYNIAHQASNISIRQLADTIARIACKKVIIQQPDSIEQSGYSIIKKAVFSTTKLEQLGWHVTGNMQDKLMATIEECRLRT